MTYVQQGQSYEPDFEASGTDFFEVDGTIQIGRQESVVGDDVDDNRTALANEWYADLNGTLQTPDGQIVLDGSVAGQFRGTRVNNPNTDFPIKGLSGASRDGTHAVIGGEEVPAYVGIFAEN